MVQSCQPCLLIGLAGVDAFQLRPGSSRPVVSSGVSKILGLRPLPYPIVAEGGTSVEALSGNQRVRRPSLGRVLFVRQHSPTGTQPRRGLPRDTLQAAPALSPHSQVQRTSAVAREGLLVLELDGCGESATCHHPAAALRRPLLQGSRPPSQCGGGADLARFRADRLPHPLPLARRPAELPWPRRSSL